MILIARNNGPTPWEFINDESYKPSDLIQGKEYKVVSWHYNDNGNWVTRVDDFINPGKAKFYVTVVNEHGVEADYWNDYFLSTEEVRQISIDKLLESC
jgi:hypothetical protein